MGGLPQRGVSPAESYEGVGPKFTLFPTETRDGLPRNRLSVVDLLRSRPQIGRSMHPRAGTHAPSSPPRRPIFASGRAARGRQSKDCPHERVAHSSARGGPLVRPQTTLSVAMQLNQSAIICCSLTLASSCRHARSWCAEGDSPPRDQQDDHLHLPVISSRCGAQRARVAGDTPPCIALLSRLQQPRVAEPDTPPDPAPLTRWCPDCISTAGGVGQNGR